MKLNTNQQVNSNNSFNENFNCDKMKVLLNEGHKESFSEKFNKWLRAYTQDSREKVWIDIESYNAG